MNSLVERGDSLLLLVITALSVSLAFTIQGYGERLYGCLVPGALAGLSIALVSRREDWQKRFISFMFLGSLGWALGTSMSTFQVIGYTHSDYWDSVLYGVACLFVIGFLWGSVGGMACALPACLPRGRLETLYPPIFSILAAWGILRAVTAWCGVPYDHFSDWVNAWLARSDTASAFGGMALARRGIAVLQDYEMAWLPALAAMAALLLLYLLRRKWTWGMSLLMGLAVGWWIGFLVLVLGFGWRMTPPRSDNWAGMVGMSVALMIFLLRSGYPAAVYSGLVTGSWGGIGFVVANTIKLYIYYDNPQSDYPTVMFQVFGLVNGIGLSMALGYIAERTPPVEEEPERKRGTEAFAAILVLLGIPYLMIMTLFYERWIPERLLPPDMGDLPITFWLHVAYGVLALSLLIPWIRHVRSPLPLVPVSAFGKGQWVFLALLWIVVIVSLLSSLPFDSMRGMTDGLVYMDACVCTLFMLWASPGQGAPAPVPMDPQRMRRVLLSSTVVWLLIAVLMILVSSGLILYLLDAPTYGHYFRFGPNAWKPHG